MNTPYLVKDTITFPSHPCNNSRLSYVLSIKRALFEVPPPSLSRINLTSFSFFILTLATLSNRTFGSLARFPATESIEKWKSSANSHKHQPIRRKVYLHFPGGFFFHPYPVVAVFSCLSFYFSFFIFNLCTQHIVDNHKKLSGRCWSIANKLI